MSLVWDGRTGRLVDPPNADLISVHPQDLDEFDYLSGWSFHKHRFPYNYIDYETAMWLFHHWDEDTPSDPSQDVSWWDYYLNNYNEVK